MTKRRRSVILRDVISIAKESKLLEGKAREQVQVLVFRLGLFLNFHNRDTVISMSIRRSIIGDGTPSSIGREVKPLAQIEISVKGPGGLFQRRGVVFLLCIRFDCVA